MAGVVRLKPSQLKEIAREDIERRRQSTPIAEDDGISFSRQNSRERESLEQLVLRVFEVSSTFGRPLAIHLPNLFLHYFAISAVFIL